MPDVIQSLWVGPRLSAMERLCISSFLQNGHAFHLYVYQDTEGIPEGTVVLDGNAILPASRIFTYREQQSVAGFANFFRYKLLLERGGWWVDTDTICLRPFEFSQPLVFSSEVSGGGGPAAVNLGAIKVPAGAAVMQFLWSACEALDPGELQWGQCGPALMRRAVERFSLDRYVQAPEVFCPISWQEWEKELAPEAEWSFGQETVAIHLWNEMWRRNGADKDGKWAPQSLYEGLKRRYLAGGRRPVTNLLQNDKSGVTLKMNVE